MNVEYQSSIQSVVDELLSERSLPVSEEHPCPYLPDLQARNEGFVIDDLPGGLYRAFLDRGFRRSGKVVYRPACGACRACRQLRVPVVDFVASRSQRRVVRRNSDVSVTLSANPKPTPEKWRLFHAYITDRHDEQMSSDYAAYVDFLYDSPIEFTEMSYLLGKRLVGVSIVDVCSEALSSVYMYFDPALHARSLGTFSILWEIDHCRRNGIPYYYLGFFVAGSKTMAYKGRFKPHELLDEKFAWCRVNG